MWRDVEDSEDGKESCKNCEQGALLAAVGVKLSHLSCAFNTSVIFQYGTS